jgi:hypothetical protein
MNVEETPFDLSAAILVDFLDGALQSAPLSHFRYWEHCCAFEGK